MKEDKLSMDEFRMRTLKAGTLPRIEDCKEYIEACGYTFKFFNNPWYVFRSSDSGRDIAFTLTEIRHAYRCGW